jgi:hypothetical protein
MTILTPASSSNMPASSGSFNFSVTRDDIIRRAMMNLGLLEQSEVPTAQEVADCAQVLNMTVKQLAGVLDKAPGFKMWQRQRAALFLSPTQYMYSVGPTSADHWAGGVTGIAAPALYNQWQTAGNLALGATVIPNTNTTGINIGDQIGIQNGSSIFWTTVSAVTANVSISIPAPGLPAAIAGSSYVWNYTTQAQRPMEILTGLLRDINNTDTPLTKMTLEQYEALPTKTQPGFVQDPMAFYYEAQMQNGNLYIDCSGAQDVTKHLHFVWLRESQDFDNPGDAPEYPQEWFLHLAWSLSLQICGMFDGDWTADRQAAYSVAVTQAKEGNPQVDSNYFQPEGEDGY